MNMEKFLHKHHLLLNHGPRRSFAEPRTLFRNSSSSDVDFDDVFGGPPRRSSMNYDWRQSAGDETDNSQVFRGKEEDDDEEEEQEEEEKAVLRNPWTGLGEKPVFGEERLNRRRRQANHFYDDIFRGEEREPSNSTPERHGMDPFSSTPASRILSPARPLPPQTEPFHSSSLPALLSLQGKFTKEMDFPASSTPLSSSHKNSAADLNGLGSPVSSSTAMSRFSPQVVIPGEDGSRTDPRSFHRQSSLSKDFSFNKFETTDQEALCKKKSNMSHVNDSSSQFHFSIYKWASKGVPIAILLQGRNSSRPKERSKVRSSETEELAPVSVADQLSSVSGDNFEPNGSSRLVCENQDYTRVNSSKNNDRVDSFQSVQEVPSAKAEPKSVGNLHSTILETPGNLVPQNSGRETRPSFAAPSNVYSSAGAAPEKLVSNKEEHKPELKPLHCFFKDDSTIKEELPKVKEGKGNAHTSGRAVHENRKVITGNAKILNFKKENNPKLRDSRTDSEEKLVSDNIKGKVKDFVKIFNQEAPAELLNNTRSDAIEKNTLKVEDGVTVCATKGDNKEQVINARDNGKLRESTLMVDQTQSESEKPPLGQNSTASKGVGAFYGRKRSSLSWSGSNQSFASGIGNTEESHIADLQCQVEELPHEEEVQPHNSQNGQNQEKAQELDARIRQWSNGKEGNIRSLLSTLQYILWAESGWKPVPLVNIIEGNSVKRAYQKALLCLHPDKLQQKAAEPHQKYIAEKVFDILQEAWTHFNALGSF